MCPPGTDGDGIPEDAFTLTTAYTGHNAAGQPGAINPPGHGTADVTSFTYAVPGRNGLLADTRTDPVIGTIDLDYDGLNRRTAVTDPNGITTQTVYDPLDRVEQVISAAGSPDALATEYRYGPFGDLESILHPRGNVTVYGHDGAGRLVEIRRQAGESLAAGDQRTFYTLDGFGQRVREDLQTWDGSAWQTRSSTESVYTSTCYLDRTIHDPDGGGAEVTEYAFDCDRNLSAIWDAEHPSSAHPPSQVYRYDELDRLVEVRTPWVPGTDCRAEPAPADCAVTLYRYDVQDHLTQVVDAEGNATDYLYSDRDLLTHEISPVSGTTAHRYDDHGEAVESTDGRGITVHRTLDAADRVTLVDHPDDTLDVVYAYDVAPAACQVGTSHPAGRLASITRDGVAVEYCWDAHGRNTRDGALVYTHDANGNLATIQYPGGVEATYQYDFADRAVALSVTTPNQVSPLAVASHGKYEPAGPLTDLDFGNGTSEARGFDGRYFPDAITWSGADLRTWTYQTDAVGNVTSIEATGTCGGDVTVANQTLSTQQEIASCADLELGPALTLSATADVTFRAAGGVVIQSGFSVGNGGRMVIETGAAVQSPAEVRTYQYQDGPWYLTRADGPWGQLDWTYDRTGNRLTETRDRSGTPDTETYLYTPNGTGGNTALLDEVLLAPTGSADYAWDAAGNLDALVRGANRLDFSFDDASRLDGIDRGDGTTVFDSVAFRYDGRGFLRLATDPATGANVEPLYDSAGLLQALAERDASGTLQRRHTVFYLAGRPVAQLTQDAGVETWQYLTTDHLGTPLLAADDTGAVTWSGGFEPFGRDYAEGTPEAALAHDLFLRLPGQWETGLWADAALGSGGMYYNVWRWYQAGAGRYTRPDPVALGVLGSTSRPRPVDIEPLTAYYLAMLRTGNPKHEHPYLYSVQNPILYQDPLGLFGPAALATAGGACAAVDGPFPFGDVIGVPLLVIAGGWAATEVIKDWWGQRGGV